MTDKIAIESTSYELLDYQVALIQEFKQQRKVRCTLAANNQTYVSFIQLKEKEKRKMRKPNTDWLVEVEWRVENRPWLKLTQKIAFIILTTLKSKNMSKKELSVLSGINLENVNLIVKGNYPLSVKEISSLESVLKIKLI